MSTIARHLYVHVPFCARRCSYCDFAIAVRRDVPVDAFVSGLRAEIEIRFPDGGGDLDTVYVGGGTPSRLGGAGIARVLNAVRETWGLAAGAEVTIEANPEDVDRDSAAAWRRAGVTRASLGAQSFDDAALTWMHRTHDGERVSTAVEALTHAGLENWSVDLIFALPSTVKRDWQYDLDQALSLSPHHLSCYGLTVESHTPLARWRERGELAEASEDAFEDEFLTAHQSLTAAGFEHYEVSNYARPGRRSRHNEAYWRRAPYVGLGPSAHGFDGAVRRWNEREYAAWSTRVSRGEDPAAGEERLAPEQISVEEIYLGLRSLDGVQISGPDRRIVEGWRDAGWARIEGNRVWLTETGWLRLDALATALTDARSRF